MRARKRDIFTTVRTEGYLLPVDLLQRITEGDKTLKGLEPETYHISKNERLNEVINRAWKRCQTTWNGFQKEYQVLPDADTGTTLTRERWLLVLFQELAYGRLLTSKAREVGGKRYPVSHFWNHMPIHLVSFRQTLDRRTPGVAGAARLSPHGLVQEFLNRSDDHLWGMVSNGLGLRLLRDNASLTRQAYVEFDLEGMMSGEVYSDFILLFLLLHQSRVEAEQPEKCLLEQWTRAAQEQGTRALDQLRRGVEQAITALGKGFLAHPGNGGIREKLRNGELGAHDLYQQLLRLVYRLIFLFVAEDRNLLLLPQTTENTKRLYLDHYSLNRFRRMAGRVRGTRHADLWEGLRVTFKCLYQGEPALGLDPLGGFLFSPDAMPDLNSAGLSNDALLEAIRRLSHTKEGRSLRPVDYRNLGTEELGSVYESLLELHPEVNTAAATFDLRIAAGSDRKTTGSYYTPSSLINCLLDSALEPVIENAIQEPNPEKALLELKVVDPACGSGHFLIAAAHRMAKHLAMIRTGEAEPAPEERRKAIRDVVSHCIYGVDLNPLAVELCKVSLWIETLDPGKPLGFLDHRIQLGNSLVGATSELLADGIPDDAFKPVEGDDRKLANIVRGRNRAERLTKQKKLFSGQPVGSHWQEKVEEFLQWGFLPEDHHHEANDKAARYQTLVKDPGLKRVKEVATLWTSAFFWPISEQTATNVPTEDRFRQFQTGDIDLPSSTKDHMKNFGTEHRFFHWHMVFPEVFVEDKGFDCVIGNPPWERIKLQEKEFFAQRDPAIAEAPNAAARKRLITRLENKNPDLWKAFCGAKRHSEAESLYIRNSGRYPLNAIGDINTYQIFAGLAHQLIHPKGRAGIIVPSGIATDDSNKKFFKDLSKKNALLSLYDFENREKLFPEVDSRMKFCLLTMGGPNVAANGADFAFFLTNAGQLKEENRHFALSSDEIALLNPNTRTCPIFRSKRDAEIAKAIYRRVPVLLEKRKRGNRSPWGIKFSTMFHMSNDSHLFRTKDQLLSQGLRLEGNIFVKNRIRFLPLFEAKMVHHFDHRWATYDGSDIRDVTQTEKQDPNQAACGRYWVEAREVYARSADLPKGLRQALAERNNRVIILALTHLLFSHWLQKAAEGSDEKAMKVVFPVWKAFVSYHEMAQNIAPTQLGVCGDNPGCFRPLGPDYLPAAPLDKIVDSQREKTAWYASDPRSISAYLHFTSPYARYIDSAPRLCSEEEALDYAENLLERATPRWFVGFRDICRSTDERTVVGGIFPQAAVGNNLPVWTASKGEGVYLTSILSSFACDFAARFKVGGTHLNFFIAEQLSVLEPTVLDGQCLWDQTNSSISSWLLLRIMELIYTAWDLEAFAKEFGWNGPPFRWKQERRFFIRCELDAAFFHLYLPTTTNGNWKPASITEGAACDETPEELAHLKTQFQRPRDAVGYIMENFPIVKRKDEQKYGEYRTRRVILACYDAMSESMKTGKPYQTILDPPPGPPENGLPEWKPGQLKPNDWPPHIHLPKEYNPDQGDEG